MESEKLDIKSKPALKRDRTLNMIEIEKGNTNKIIPSENILPHCAPEQAGRPYKAMAQ